MMKRKSQTTILFLIITLVLGTLSGSFALETVEDIKVYFDGEQLEFDTNPEIVNGRTMVPVSTIFKALNMKVNWDADLQKVTAEKEGLGISLIIGSSQTEVNGSSVTIDAAAYITSGRTMVPLRFVAENTGAVVEWNADTRSVMIYSGELSKEAKVETEVESEIVSGEALTYKIVDTGVTKLHTDKTTSSGISEGDAFFGQDANYDGYQPSYTDNGDGTVTDNVTGLMWQQTMDSKMTFDEAIEYANSSNIGGYDDWRMPTIKELFSLILFTGKSGGEVAKELYIDTDYFDQPIGDKSIGEREIDAQVWSSTEYVGKTMKADDTVFGVNFVDGRIKGYGAVNPRTRDENTAYFRLVRGNESYGQNVYVDNGDGTISDLATGLMWQMADDGQTRDWEEALAYSEDLELAGYDDWRLPNVKELQSLVDYSKSVQTTGTPAIDNMFVLSEIKDPDGESNYGFYWTGTTHQDGNNTSDSASYVAFGEAQGEMHGSLLDVHGCGAVRSDPKSGDTSDYPDYFGPQGDVRYVYNYVLSVRTIN